MKYYKKKDSVLILVDNESEVKFLSLNYEVKKPYRIKYGDEFSSHKIMDFDIDKTEETVSFIYFGFIYNFFIKNFYKSISNNNYLKKKNLS